MQAGQWAICISSACLPKRSEKKAKASQDQDPEQEMKVSRSSPTI
jgi:hypothetical protein